MGESQHELDSRDEELMTLQAIFPELDVSSTPNGSSILGQGDARIASIDIQVQPTQPVPVAFISLMSLDNSLLPPEQVAQYELQNGGSMSNARIHTVTHFPPLQLSMTLPSGYPDHGPPELKLSCQPAWLPVTTLARLESQGRALWEEYEHSPMLYAYIDLLQQEAENCFGLTTRAEDFRNSSGKAIDKGVVQPLSVSDELETLLLDYDDRKARELFNTHVFPCEVCLEPKLGSKCHRMARCGHVFCKQCLQDFFGSAITEGNVNEVKCPAIDCELQGLTVQQKRSKKRHSLHPRELLAIPIEEVLVQRYVHLKIKKKLEADKNMKFCPRTWCQAPARTPRYAKYQNIKNVRSYPDSSSSSEDEADKSANGVGQADANRQEPEVVGEDTKQKGPSDDEEEKLAVCSRCAFAFCAKCQQSWHGELMACRRRATPGELTAEEEATQAYLAKYSTPCPVCGTPVSKTMGCNHITCPSCQNSFCYICSSWLDHGNPYRHFNTKGQPCYLRLWEGEEGDVPVR